MVSTISEGGSYHLEPLICWDPNIFCLFLSCVFLGLFFSFILFFHLGVFLNLIFFCRLFWGCWRHEAMLADC